MRAIQWRHRLVMVVSLLAAPFLAGADGNGCDGPVATGGGDTGGGNAAGDCVIGGCSSQLCLEPPGDVASTCEWLDVYACYQQHGVCERDANNQCGWKQTQALTDCIAAASNPMPARTPVSGQCIRNQPDACSTDADCTTGGCGGELCHGVGNEGVTTCDCTAPQAVTCGCVNGTCSWWK